MQAHAELFIIWCVLAGIAPGYAGVRPHLLRARAWRAEQCLTLDARQRRSSGDATGVRSDPLAGAPQARRLPVLSYSTHLAHSVLPILFHILDFKLKSDAS